MKTIIVVSMCLFAGWAEAQDTSIHWPDKYNPATSKFYVHNEIEIAASPERIWSILLDAEAWPKWYKGAQDVRMVKGGGPTLSENSVFEWKTMGMQFESTIQEFEANQRLSWESKKKSIQGYHAWLIIPIPGGCRVITDESQNGWLTFFEKTFQGKKLKRLHDVWLSELKKRAEASGVTSYSTCFQY
ncbi:MAG: SRPBCC domain-containing protein [Cytophagales bacterium]|nr:SRPBCC domain-containing protein [Cytophagales bacterium]